MRRMKERFFVRLILSSKLSLNAKHSCKAFMQSIQANWEASPKSFFFWRPGVSFSLRFTFILDKQKKSERPCLWPFRQKIDLFIAISLFSLCQRLKGRMILPHPASSADKRQASICPFMKTSKAERADIIRPLHRCCNIQQEYKAVSCRLCAILCNALL